MSASLDALKVTVDQVVGEIAVLRAQPPPPAGTPDSELDLLNAKLQAALNPPAAPATPAV